jgi:dihydrofolate reductase
VEEGLRGALATDKPVFVIGGASIYAAAWPYCHRFYLTRIEQAFSGDSLFPAEIPLDDWPVHEASVKVFRERRTGQEVACHFMQYRQPYPRPLPLSDCI